MVEPQVKIPVFLPRPLDWNLANVIAVEFGNPHQHSNFGPLVSRLESELAELLRVDSSQVVVFSNCTDALIASISTLHGAKRAIIPGFSFVATLRAAQIALPGSVLLEDVSPTDWTLSPREGTNLDDVMVPVAPFGTDPSQLLVRFAQQSAVIDAAASLATTPDLSNLEARHAVCFSMHATKVLGAGEGGFAVFGDSSWAERARAFSSFGRIGEGFMTAGANLKMSEVQAAFCLSRLVTKEEELQEWRAAQKVASLVSAEHNLGVQPHGFDTVHPYWIVALESADHRVRLETELRFRGVGYRRWWPEELSVVVGKHSLGVSSDLAARTLGLPMFCGLNDAHGQVISDAISAVGT